jgi:hypothetical protein
MVEARINEHIFSGNLEPLGILEVSKKVVVENQVSVPRLQACEIRASEVYKTQKATAKPDLHRSHHVDLHPAFTCHLA